MSNLVTARDLAERDGMSGTAEWIRRSSLEAVQRGIVRRPWDGKSVSGAPVQAFVDFGRWGAQCECGGYCYVDPDEPVFFCLRCGNRNSGMARPVLFPGEMGEIEAALLARPVVVDPNARNRVEQALIGRPAVESLVRSWYPGQSLASLLAENERLLPGGE